MTMRKRLLRVKFELPNGGTYTADEFLMLRVRAKKVALSIQNKATIEIGGLTDSIREFLLSNFTAFNKRLREQGQIDAYYVNVIIEAGYDDDGQQSLNLVYKGQVVLAELASPPPNIVVRLTCYTQQIDRTKFITERAPSPITFENFCKYAAQQMGLASVVVDTSINQQVLINPGRTAYVAAALLPEIQNYSRNTIAAFIDDDRLIVKDKDKILNPDAIKFISEFIGSPTWNEWGVNFTVMYDPDLRLAQGVMLNSILNPSLNDTTFVILSLEFDLASRDDNFVINVDVAPTA